MNKEQLLESLKMHGFSEEIVNAFSKVKRENFIPEDEIGFAYYDEPLPIGYGQTISQPYTIAFMLNLLELKDEQKILEIGSGSGYVLALINQLGRNLKIYGVECIGELVKKSKSILKNHSNIKIIYGSGFKGLKKYAPYDRILISASANEIPQDLIKQLKNNGVLVIPVKNSIFQIKKTKKKIIKKEFPGFVFVPLIEN